MDENNLNDKELEENNEYVDNNVEINNIKEVNNTKKVSKKTVEKVKYVNKKEKNKRKRDREIVVEYRKPSFFMSLLLILIGFMIATIFYLLLYIFKFNKEVELYSEPQNEEIVQEDTKEDEKVKAPEVDMDVNGEFIKSLYDKIPMSLSMQVIYKYQKTTQEDFTYNQKMLFVLEKMKNEKMYEITSSEGLIDRLENITDKSGSYVTKIQKYEIKNVEEYFKTIFGCDERILKEDIETNMGYRFEYDATDDCFYGYSYDSEGSTSMAYSTKIDSCEKNSDGTEIYIYDYYIRSYPSSDGKYNIYADSESNNVIGEEEENPTYLDNEKNVYFVKDEIIDKYKDNGLVKFKHTYKLDNTGNYYWYSCEQVNIE